MQSQFCQAVFRREVCEVSTANKKWVFLRPSTDVWLQTAFPSSSSIFLALAGHHPFLPTLVQLPTLPPKVCCWNPFFIPWPERSFWNAILAMSLRVENAFQPSCCSPLSNTVQLYLSSFRCITSSLLLSQASHCSVSPLWNCTCHSLFLEHPFLLFLAICPPGLSLDLSFGILFLVVLCQLQVWECLAKVHATCPHPITSYQ